MARFAATFALSLMASPAFAEFAKIDDRETFLAYVEGRELRLGAFGVRLRVNGDGTIAGSGMGAPVTGTWAWQDGYFCREMDWSGTPIPYNCQLVEVSGAKMRFTVDRGAGRSADFTLR